MRALALCYDSSKGRYIIVGDTVEAELIGMSSAANELMWIRQCTDWNIKATKAILRGDNQSANLLAVNLISTDRPILNSEFFTAHTRVREYVVHDEMDVQWVGTK